LGATVGFVGRWRDMNLPEEVLNTSGLDDVVVTVVVDVVAVVVPSEKR